MAPVHPPHSPVPSSQPLQPDFEAIIIDSEEQNSEDIYRGERPPPPRSSSPDSTASTSSSPSFPASRRLGAIAAVVETAITRWARAKSPSSSRSSSPSSSRSSIVTVSRSQMARRRKRYPSSGTLKNMHSELDVAARIKARRQQSRHVPRGFVLYLPPPLAPGTPPSSRGTTATTGEGTAHVRPERVYLTSSLPSVLDHLDSALKRSTRAQRNSDRGRLDEGLADVTHHPDLFTRHDHILPDHVKAPSRAASFTDLEPFRKERKGKHKETRTGQPTHITLKSLSPSTVEETRRAQMAWWLDVSSPTWEDMRAIGKLLHLHPLTLEDILHQDPREKLELFPRLGYYFIVFRAIEGHTTRERLHCNSTDNTSDEGIVGEANVYLVVFREGICSFHFSDISEHTDRVRNRVLLLEELIDMSSDWIAHGILDSVVDSFIPFLEDIEKEVVAAENIVFSDLHSFGKPQNNLSLVGATPDREDVDLEEKGHGRNTSNYSIDEKHGITSETVETHFSLLPPTTLRFLRRVKRLAHSTCTSALAAIQVHVSPPASTTAATLRRMARARRLVTSLTRLLATKSEVVTQIRKRLLITSESGLGNGADKGEDAEVAIYMGDVHDHILTLQASLAHYERMLSQSHPTYLSQLRTTVSKTKGGTDKAIMMLTISSMGVLCIQTLIGLFSLNVTVPTNGHYPGNPFSWFGAVLGVAILILCTYLSTVRRWWLQARRRRSTAL